MPNGIGYQSFYPTLPNIPTQKETSTPPQSSNQISPPSHPRSSPQVRQNPPVAISKTPGPHSLPDHEQRNYPKTSYTDSYTNYDTHAPPSDSFSHSVPKTSHPKLSNQAPQIVLSNWEDSDNCDKPQWTDSSTKQTNPFPNKHTINRPPADIRTSHTSSDPHLDPQQHHMISSPRRGQTTDKPYEEQYLPPLSATPPHTAGEKSTSKPNNQSNRNNVEEDSGIAGFSPDTYRGNDNHVLDR